MSRLISGLADILAPMGVEEFLSDHHLKRPVHIPGSPEKFASVMDWDMLSGLLCQNGLWTGSALQMVMDKRTLETREYCRPGVDRTGNVVPMADIDQVGAWLRRGASLVLNDIDSLTPGVKAVAAALEEGVGGKAQANLYCSWNAHQAFDSHFDTHDVYAIHVAGEKAWKIYQCPIPDPIAHPSFKHFGQEFHDRTKGEISFEVTMRPGDMLYLPRGWYHDALAVSPGTIHIAFGLTSVIGLDLVSMLFERAVADPLFRRTLPRPGGEHAAALADHMAALGDRVAEVMRDPAMIEQARRYVEAYRYSRASIRLPDDALERRWRRLATKLKVVERKQGSLLTDGSRAVPIPPGMEKPIAWMLDRETFIERELFAAHPVLHEAGLRKLLADMQAMKVIGPG